MENKEISKNDGGMYAAKNNNLFGVWLFFLLVFIDQLTKLFAEAYFAMPGSPDKLAVIPGWIYLCIEHNPGIAYGMGSDASPALKIGVIALTAVMMLALTVFYFKADKRRGFLRLALVFIVAGGIGNLIDRAYFKVWQEGAALLDVGVRDMVDLNRFGFAVCNFADFFITGGAVMLVLALLFFDKEAFFPLTKKYKALAAEAAAQEEEKEAERAKKKGQNG